MKTIVVGVDDSEVATAALEHAIDEAARRRARVSAVSVFDPAEHWLAPRGGTTPTIAQTTRMIEDRLRDLVKEIVAARPALAGVPVQALALLGRPARVLVEQAAGADLLVVGHRGRGALTSALLGSVSLHCVLHAPCTVTVVRTGPVRVREPQRAVVSTTAPAGPALA
ncbi:universal stress protein [Pseudonocardia acaciae]|uniref:universal stress protein n=1 Tax=Pseudonocardia acaciae TaxID=551276 RepID=UPI000AECEC17|nr:universal stress protein [Pseudonocardia acaciae]